MKSRAEELSSIANQQFDLCVIGGGATGAACALDAQLRGIRTVMIEASDFAGATSSAATKIIHGGVRYLEEAVKGLDVKEYHVLIRALHERVRMLDNAPHLTRRLEFLVPSYSWFNAAYLNIGLKMYDWLAGPGRIAPSKFLPRDETLKRMPDLKQKGLVGAVAYSDGQSTTPATTSPWCKVSHMRGQCAEPRASHGLAASARRQDLWRGSQRPAHWEDLQYRRQGCGQ